MNSTDHSAAQVGRFQQMALIVGVIGLVATAAGFFVSQEQFFQSYLFGYIFWIQIALGCFALVMLHHLVGGNWSFAVRRIAESGAMTLPLMALLFLPIIFGIPQIYIWADPEFVAEFKLMQHKEPYLNVPFFIGRAVFYFTVWILLAYLLNRWSLKQDDTGDPSLTKRLKRISAPGLILYMLTATFASYDWMMSLEPIWFSSIYGVIFISGHALTTMAFLIILMRLVSDQKPLSEFVTNYTFGDLGNFLLAFISFWAYIAFSQYLILWSANLPETITWYITRTQGGWQWLAFALIFLQFAIPFAILLSRRAKLNVRLLVSLAVFVLLIRFIDIFWLIMPAFYEQGFHLHWLDIVAPIGIGGIWIAFFFWQLNGKSLLPLHDPRFQEVSAHE